MNLIKFNLAYDSRYQTNCLSYGALGDGDGERDGVVG